MTTQPFFEIFISIEDRPGLKIPFMLTERNLPDIGDVVRIEARKKILVLGQVASIRYMHFYTEILLQPKQAVDERIENFRVVSFKCIISGVAFNAETAQKNAVGEPVLVDECRYLPADFRKNAVVEISYESPPNNEKTALGVVVERVWMFIAREK